MKKRFIIFTLTIFMIMSFVGCTTNAAEKETYFIECDGIYYTYQNKDNLLPLIKEQLNIMDTAHLMADSARSLGYDDNHDIILIAQSEYKSAEVLYNKYLKIYNQIVEEYNLRWEKREKEYPNAAYIWKYLKDNGFNDFVCAGILGNMMSEAGGQTLKIQPEVKDKNENYYGICQWSKKYYPTIWNGTLEEQCAFLIETIENEFATFGKNYKKDFTYQDFLKLEDEKEAAKCFALVYERCGKASYSKRQKNAEKAYTYFAD